VPCIADLVHANGRYSHSNGPSFNAKCVIHFTARVGTPELTNQGVDCAAAGALTLDQRPVDKAEILRALIRLTDANPVISLMICVARAAPVTARDRVGRVVRCAGLVSVGGCH
jgi:hypothetical protein